MPPRTPPQDPQYLDDNHKRIVEFAADYFEDEEERGNFVDTLMERHGYERQQGWGLPAGPPQGGRGSGGGGGTKPARPSYFK